MTQIKIEVPANDHIALNAFAEALQRIAAERAPSTSEYHCEAPVGVDGKPLTPPQRAEVSGHGEVTKEALEALVKISDETSTHGEFEKGEKLYDAEIERMDAELASRLAADDTLDADGIPHDKRIHSKGATRLADDTWRLKRKPVDKTDEEWDEYVKSVKAELKAVQDIPAPSTLDEQAIADLTPDQVCEEVKEKIESGEVTIEAPLTPPVIDEPVTQFEGVTPPVIDEPTTQPPVAPITPPTSLTPPVVDASELVTPPVVDAPSDQPSVTTFQELMLYITSNAKKRGADNDMIRETLLEVDPALTAIPLIATRTDLIPKFVTVLEAKL